MKYYDQSAAINHNQDWLYILDHPFRISIIGCSGPGKTNALCNLTKSEKPDNEKTYLYVKGPHESQCQLLINGRGKVGIKKIK